MPELHRPRYDHGAEIAAVHGIKRSEHWPAVERAFREANPRCAACREDAPEAAVQVHHLNPFHYVTHPRIARPDLELDPRNLISLCEHEHDMPAPNHHLRIGHLGNFKEGNLLAREDAAGRYHGMSEVEIEDDPDWQIEERAGRLKPLDQFTDDDFIEFRARLDRELPVDRALCARYGIVIGSPAVAG